ncbi:type VI secretion system baseplate subunit TssG [Azorhizobium caulinodans]|uniref:type VI secretion system baseplate subunit TssG n=1 Tax=Azorhizobium caulinodans TaxID=7 RepID=UPI0002E9829B|nr:type VI secretion system baseplate subunit TssG [Azorhizobium caulinodans]
MAGARRLPSSPVIDALLRAPHSFDLAQAVRVVDALFNLPHADSEGSEETATSDAWEAPGLWDGGSIRFISDTSLRYPVAAITRASQREPGDPLELTVSTIGLIGPLGVLPYAYTAHANEGMRERNEGVRAFLDMFNHRAVSLFCRASAKYRIALAHEGANHDLRDVFTLSLRGLTGLGSPQLENRLAIPDDLVLHNAGLFSGQTRPLAALEALLSRELGQSVRVEPFTGGWVEVPAAEQTRLGGASALEGQHAHLDSSAMVGARAWVAQHHFRIHVGPTDEAELVSLLPGTPRAALIRDLVQLFCGLEFSFDLNVMIKAASVPAARLCQGEDDPGGARLGQLAWVLSAPSPIDRNDAIFPLSALD